MKQNKLENFVSEESSYFIRESFQNPEDIVIYMSNSCEAWKGENSSLVTCYKNDGTKAFEFDPVLGRFAYSYLGSWHINKMEDYNGDSSIFTFGTCEEYYR